MEFWTTLIKITAKLKKKSLESLQANCTHVAGCYWIMEGDTDVLRDYGVIFEEIAEGAVGPLDGLTTKQLKQVCLDSYEVTI